MKGQWHTMKVVDTARKNPKARLRLVDNKYKGCDTGTEIRDLPKGFIKIWASNR